MQNGKCDLKTVFDGDKVFCVPRYQRAYTWEEKQLEDFFDDLINQPKGKPYFFGTFLFHEKGVVGEYAHIDIVDGQQRLTTFSVFASAAISVLNREKPSKMSSRTVRRYIKDDEVFKLELMNEDNHFFRTYVISLNGSSLEAVYYTPSQRRLLAARKFFDKKLSAMSGEDVKLVFDKAVSSEVLLYVVDNASSATQIFELLNDRGRRLSDLESIKSFLMYKLNLVKKQYEQAQDEIQSTFGNIYRIIEASGLSERDILRYHTIAFENSTVDDYDDPKQYLKKTVNRLVEGGKNDETASFIMGYNERILKSFELYVKIKNNELKIKQLDDLFMIGRVGPFYPLMMKVLKEDPDRFEELIMNLVRFTFRAALVGLRSNGESDLYNAIRNNMNTIDLVRDIVASNWWDINARAKEALDHVNHYERLNNNIVKFILFKYENFLRGTEFPPLTITNYFNQDAHAKLNIEHINAKKAKDINMTDDFKENFLHRLGNLVLDSVESNSRKGCKGTGKKLVAYSNAPLKSQNEINNAKVSWKSITKVKQYIGIRNEKLRRFVMDEFGM